MQTPEHAQHIASRVSHNNCDECRADCERQFLQPAWIGYQFVTEYLTWTRPRFAAIREGFDSIDARNWRRKFRLALNRRITLKAGAEVGRKRNDGYRERLRQFPRSTDSNYLRQFAQRGASTLY